MKVFFAAGEPSSSATRRRRRRPRFTKCPDVWWACRATHHV
jgi:hypothetical protein